MLGHQTASSLNLGDFEGGEVKVTLIVILGVSTVVFAWLAMEATEQRHTEQVTRGFFRGVSIEQVRTMRVSEDGLYEINYKDGTSITGCLAERVCNE